MRGFRDRVDAGNRLAERLLPLAEMEPVVVGLPRGGVVVAAEVAHALAAPLDVVVVRKLGVPSQPELAMGAVGEDGVRVLNDEVMRVVRITPEQLEAVETRARAEVERRAAEFRRGRAAVTLRDRTVIVVDDGIATGATARAALTVARAHGAQRVILAVPVAPPETLRELAPFADEVICLESPSRFHSVGQWYDNFTQTTDADVIHLLASQV